MTTTLKNYLTVEDASEMDSSPTGSINLGFVDGILTQKDAAGEEKVFLTDLGIEDRVRETPLTGFSDSDTTPVTASDTVLEGFGKLQGQVDEKLDKSISYTGSKKSEFFHESDGGGYRFTDGVAETVSFIGCNDDSSSPIKIEFYAKDSTTGSGSRIIQSLAKAYYTSEKVDSTYASTDEIAALRDLSSFVPNTRTVNGQALSSNVALDTDDVPEGSTYLYNVQADFAETDSNEPSFIKNKPTVQDGHTIVNPAGTSMNQRAKLRFIGDGIESVTDDATNNVTIVTVAGGESGGMTNPMTDLGDIIVGEDDTGSPGKLSMGSANQVLTVASDLGGLSWKTPFQNPMTTSGDIITTSAGAPARIGLGPTNSILTSYAGAPAWRTPTFLVSPMTTAGDIIVGGTSGAAQRLAIGSSGQVLTVASDVTSLSWKTPFVSPLTTYGDMIYSDASGNPTRLPIGENGQFLVSLMGVPFWSSVNFMSNPMSSSGDIIIGLTNGSPTRLAIGVSGQFLTVASTGLPAWGTPFANPMTAAGDLITGGTGGSPLRRAIGSAGQVLTVNSTGTAVAWADSKAGIPITNFVWDEYEGYALLPLPGSTTQSFCMQYLSFVAASPTIGVDVTFPYPFAAAEWAAVCSYAEDGGASIIRFVPKSRTAGTAFGTSNKLIHSMIFGRVNNSDMPA
jgi:hypothetical protein